MSFAQLLERRVGFRAEDRYTELLNKYVSRTATEEELAEFVRLMHELEDREVVH